MPSIVGKAGARPDRLPLWVPFATMDA
jgi:hypothetical protein